jgi:hypothetical protein
MIRGRSEPSFGCGSVVQGQGHIFTIIQHKILYRPIPVLTCITVLTRARRCNISCQRNPVHNPLSVRQMIMAHSDDGGGKHL